MKPRITYEIARAASWDAGSRSMRAAGRVKWNLDDFDAAAAEFDRLLPDGAEDLPAAVADLLPAAVASRHGDT